MSNWPLLAGLLVGFLMTCGLSFLGGIMYEKWYLASALHRASKKLSQMVDHVNLTIQTATQACHHLAKFDQSQLSSQHINRLLKTHDDLLSAFDSIVTPELKASLLPKKETPPPTLVWQLQPADERTHLPDHSALELNLLNILQHTSSTQPSSLLLIQIDKFAQLASRYGHPEGDFLLQTLGKLLMGQSREEDLVCHSSDDLFAIIMPGAELTIARNIADQIRHAVRSQRFHLSNGQREILMTASFGLTSLSKTDTPTFALQRASDALRHSQRQGRNQLYWHNGTQALHHA